MAFRGTRGAALPVRALNALGLSGSSSLADARRAHRALAMQLHPDLCDAIFAAEAQYRTEKLVIINAAREAIELAARQAVDGTTCSPDAKRQWDRATKRIHLKALRGDWDAVIELISSGVDPNARTPAHGAPPIFYASCVNFLGRADFGLGDKGRLRVLEAFASHLSVDLEVKGTAMWAEDKTIFDLVSMCRCPGVAFDSLERGLQAKSTMLRQGRMYINAHGDMVFVE